MITIELDERKHQDILIRLCHEEYARVKKQRPLPTDKLFVLADIIEAVEEAEEW